MKLDELIEQEYSSKAAAAAAERARAANRAVAEKRASRKRPITNSAELDQAADALARQLGARRGKKVRS